MYLLDTNVLIGYFSDDPDIVEFVDGIRLKTDERLMISVITELELLALGKLSEGDEVLINHFLKFISIIGLESPLARKAAEFRRMSNLGLADAVIAATAEQHFHATLVTRDKELAKKASHLGVQIQLI